MATANKAPRTTLLDEINELAGWYEKHKPEAGQRIDVNASPRKLAKALGCELPVGKDGKPIQQREWNYRGRTIVATGIE